MSPTGIITAIVIGAIIGLLGRLVVPGKQPIGILVTILVGVVAALIGTAITPTIATTLHIPAATWLLLLVQVLLAAVGVALVAGVMGQRRSRL